MIKQYKKSGTLIKIKVHDPNFPEIPDCPYRILKVRGSIIKKTIHCWI